MPHSNPILSQSDHIFDVHIGVETNSKMTSSQQLCFQNLTVCYLRRTMSKLKTRSRSLRTNFDGNYTQFTTTDVIVWYYLLLAGLSRSGVMNLAFYIYIYIFAWSKYR